MRVRLSADGVRGIVPRWIDDVTAMVITSDNGKPLALFMQNDDGTIFNKNASEEDFGDVLEMLGLKSDVAYVRVQA